MSGMAANAAAVIRIRKSSPITVTALLFACFPMILLSEAALRIGVAYMINQPASDEGLYWLAIAAENGSETGMLDLGCSLQLRNSEKMQVRARYWLNKVIKESKAKAGLAQGCLDEMNKQ